MHKLVSFNRNSWKLRLALRIHRKRRATRIVVDFLHKCASFEKATEESRIIRNKILYFFNKVKRCQQLFRDYWAVQRARYEVMERQWSIFVANPRLNWVLRIPPPESPFDPTRNSFSDLLPSHILESLDSLNPFQRTQSQLPINLVNAEIAKKAAKYLKAANGFLHDSMESDGFVQDVLRMLRDKPNITMEEIKVQLELAKKKFFKHILRLKRMKFLARIEKLKLKAEMETIENLPKGATRFDVLLAHPAVTHFVHNKSAILQGANDAEKLRPWKMLAFHSLIDTGILRKEISNHHQVITRAALLIHERQLRKQSLLNKNHTASLQRKLHLRIRKVHSLHDIDVETEKSPRRKSSIFQEEKDDRGFLSARTEEVQEKKNRFSSLIEAITPRKEREELESNTKHALMKVQRLCERNLSLPLPF